MLVLNQFSERKPLMASGVATGAERLRPGRRLTRGGFDSVVRELAFGS
jgi:hypothetical protein